MLKRMRPGRPSPSMIVAIIALLFAFSGTSIAQDAVQIAAKPFNGKKIKSRSISGSKLKKNTIGGTEVNESKLGKVPSAANADKATNATNATNAQSAAEVDGFSIRGPQSDGAYGRPAWPLPIPRSASAAS